MQNRLNGYARNLFTALLFLLISAQVLKAKKPSRLSDAAENTSTPTNPYQQLSINLYVMFPGNIESLADGLGIRFRDGYLKSTVDDILKMNNFAENISSYRENKDLILERRPVIERQDTLYIRLTNTTIRNYRLKLYAKDFEQGKTVAYLEDAMTNRYRVIELTGDTTNFDFSVTADPASAANNRFRVIFVKFGTLPVHFTGIKAQARQKNVEVKWTTDNEKDIQQFDIESSVNGSDFSKIGTVLPGNTIGGNNGYTWLDKYAITGINYYRIRSTGISGEIKYSDVVKATINNESGGITVYPNPVVNHTLNLNFSDMDKGIYSLQLINSMAQVVMNRQLKYAGGNAGQAILLDTAIPQGSYTLVIQKPDNSRVQKTLFIVK